jgi:hypothetical protein
MKDDTQKNSMWKRLSYALNLTLILLLFFSLGPHLSEAQKVTVGLKGGLSQSTFVDNSSAGFATGVTGGGYFRYDINPAFSVQTEAIFNFKGADAKSGDLSAPFLRDLSGEYEIRYLEFPVLFKLNAPLGKVFHASLYTGPQLGFKTQDELDGQRLDELTNNTNTVVPIEFSGVIGGDLAVSLESFELGPLNRIVLDGRYTLGLNNTFEVSDESPSIRNASFLGTLGVEFSI